MEGSNVYTKDTVDDLDDKQGEGFMSADDLEEIDIGPGDRPRPTFISKNLSSEFRIKLMELLKEFRDCFAWEYYEMPGLSRSIVEHRLPLRPVTELVAPHRETAQAPVCRFGRGLRVKSQALSLYVERSPASKKRETRRCIQVRAAGKRNTLLLCFWWICVRASYKISTSPLLSRENPVPSLCGHGPPFIS